MFSSPGRVPVWICSPAMAAPPSRPATCSPTTACSPTAACPCSSTAACWPTPSAAAFEQLFEATAGRPRGGTGSTRCTTTTAPRTRCWASTSGRVTARLGGERGRHGHAGGGRRRRHPRGRRAQERRRQRRLPRRRRLSGRHVARHAIRQAGRAPGHRSQHRARRAPRRRSGARRRRPARAAVEGATAAQPRSGYAKSLGSASA